MPSLEPIILDSVTHLTEAHRGKVAYCASHGGTYAAYYAAAKGVAAVILNDAGIGRERAGIAGLAYLDRIGVPSAAISHRSARIGDGKDGLAEGVITFANASATRLGLATGMTCREALDRLGVANLAPSPTPPEEAEHRTEITEAARGGIRVFAVDSASLISPGDARNVIITGSHGGLLGGKPETAAKYPVVAAIYNDAGLGKDDAGVTRLPALDARGIAAACVSAFSARIGDGMSTYRDGYISAVNETARRAGGLVGQSTREFVAAIVAKAAS